MREDLRPSEASENVLKNEAAFINILRFVLCLLGSVFPSCSIFSFASTPFYREPSASMGHGVIRSSLINPKCILVTQNVSFFNLSCVARALL